ncbi:MAG: tetratricopeptide repeat protein, partial [Steroidobacteraceae bacterium]|nr:tetratricopeptide repeat protein [Steroidobacteraceae bacterium]
MSAAPEPVGTLATALAHASKLLQADPALAAEQAAEILKVVPNQPQALLLHGIALGQLGRGEAAVQSLRRAVALKPDLAEGWRVLADHLDAIGETAAAQDAYARHVRASTRDPRLLEAAAALVENRLPEAEILLREQLKRAPTDVAAIRMFAELAARIGRNADAENLLVRCLELAPGFTAARANYALVLHRANKSAEALAEVERLLAADARNPSHRGLKAAILSRLGEYDEAIGLYEGLLAEYPDQVKLWLSYGHALKTAGRQADSIEAYRKCTSLAPAYGEAWWSLANLKTFQFDADDLATMRAQLARPNLADDDRLHLDFALGKALEDAAEYAESFRHYAAGNALRLKSTPYAAGDTTLRVRRARETFTADFYAARAGWGCPSADPIFIVGLPRSGSTLLEQILASHPLVEGTMELPD